MTFASGASGGSDASGFDIKDSTHTPITDLLILATNPGAYAVKMLQDHHFAYTKTVIDKNTGLYIADPAAIEELMTNEWGAGTLTGWPTSFNVLLGANSLSGTHDRDLHQKVRGVLAPMLTDATLQRVLPLVETTAATYLAAWAEEGPIKDSYTALLTPLFEVLANHTLQLQLPADEVAKYAVVFETWNQGLTAIANTLWPWSRFNKGKHARQQLIQRFRAVLNDPGLLPGSLPAALRDTFGADSEVSSDALIFVIFAGFETMACAITGVLNRLAVNPAALEKLRAEQRSVSAKHGALLTMAALNDMPYTAAVIDETLRLAQIVASSPRIASKDINLASMPSVKSGCPVVAAWAGLARVDPATKPDPDTWRPERWTDPANKASLAAHQMPFGHGTHGCMGFRIARVTITAFLREIALNYDFKAEVATSWNNFPTGGRPGNGLPLTLTRL